MKVSDFPVTIICVAFSAYVTIPSVLNPRKFDSKMCIVFLMKY